MFNIASLNQHTKEAKMPMSDDIRTGVYNAVDDVDSDNTIDTKR